MPSAKIPALAGRGGRRMMSASPFSTPRDRAGKVSVIRFTHSRCTGFRMLKPRRVAVKMVTISLMLAPSRNWMALRMLS